jgi:hypothetical protein
VITVGSTHVERNAALQILARIRSEGANLAALPWAVVVRMQPRSQLLAGAGQVAARPPALGGWASAAGDLEGGVR